jgi:SulP family sulfate permease
LETIGSRFGGIPHSLPAPHMPELSLDRISAILPTAFSFALLGGSRACFRRSSRTA